MIRVWLAEMAHLWHAGAQWITVVLVVMGGTVWLLPGKPLGPFPATALIKSSGWSWFGAVAYADILDVIIPWGAVGAVLLLEHDCRDAQRTLLLVWSTRSVDWVGGRSLAVISWGLGWTLLASGIPSLLAAPVHFARDVILVIPVLMFLTGVAFGFTEVFHDPWAGLVVSSIVSVLGVGIHQLPFASPGQLEVFDARNHLWSSGLIANEWWLLILGLMSFGMGWMAFSFHRKRGTYQS